MLGFETVGGGGGCGGGGGGGSGGHWGSGNGGWGPGGGTGHFGHTGFGHSGWNDSESRGGHLSDSERAAAHSALSRLTGAGVSGFQGEESARSSAHAFSFKTLPNGLVSGLGSDTFAGGASGSHVPLSTFAADSISGGAALKTSWVESGTPFHLSGDTIHSAGSTAAGVKTADTNFTAGVSHTVSLSDKTTVTLTGVGRGAVIKPVGH
jgi:hypothetical protein